MLPVPVEDRVRLLEQLVDGQPDSLDGVTSLFSAAAEMPGDGPGAARFAPAFPCPASMSPRKPTSPTASRDATRSQRPNRMWRTVLIRRSSPNGLGGR